MQRNKNLRIKWSVKRKLDQGRQNFPATADRRFALLLLSGIRIYLMRCIKIRNAANICSLFFIFYFSFLIPPKASAGNVTITKTEITDSVGTVRSVFSSSEKISMRIESFCSAPVSPSRIYYKFYIKNPSGKTVFTHTGNSTEGNAGSGAAALRNIPMTFSRSPGLYRFMAELVVDGAAVSSDESKSFTVYSPNITLTYPPNGVVDLIDRPVTFRWVSSGASKYKVFVGEEKSFYNPLWTGETPAQYIQYPLNPPQAKQKLSGGVEYYWKVAGLASDGSAVASSPEIYSFTLKKESVVSSYRNLAVTGMEYDPLSRPPDNVKIKIEISNQGNQSESNVKVNLFIDGAMEGSRQLPSLIPGEKKIVEFESGGILKEAVIVTAMIEVPDENARDNIMTKTLTVPLPDELKNVPKILGKVVEKGTKNGLAGIKVKLDGPVMKEAQTGLGGQYKFERLETGQYKVKVENAADIKGGEISVDVRQKKAYAAEDIEIEAVAPSGEKEEEAGTAVVKGRITDEGTKEPVGEVKVLLMGKTASGEYLKEAESASAAKGYYKFDGVKTGEYNLVFRKEGYEEKIEDIKVEGSNVLIKDVSISAVAPDGEKKEYTNEEAWEIIKAKIKDGKLLKQLEGYKMMGIEISEGDVNEEIEKIAGGDVKIKSTELEIIK